MRRALEGLRLPFEHAGLAYDMWAPVKPDGEDAGKVPNDDRDPWFERLQRIRMPAAYPTAYGRWENALQALSATVVKVQASSRLLLGHGNPSAAEVGLTVQHTWGMPLLPGSSIKGLLHHWMVTRYGPEDTDFDPNDANHDEADRAAFRPVVWRGKRIIRGPGEAIRLLFGAPDAEDDSEMADAGNPSGANRGGLQFLDAWMVPEPISPFAKDVLTVHQRGYYGQDRSSEQPWPNDFESPNPVSFLTVKPKVSFLIAIVGNEGLAQFAMDELILALKAAGIGGKTTAGYGRLAPQSQERVRRLRKLVTSDTLQELRRYLDRKAFPPGLDADTPLKAVLAYIVAEVLPNLANADTRLAAADALSRSRFARHKKLKGPTKVLVEKLRMDE